MGLYVLLIFLPGIFTVFLITLWWLARASSRPLQGQAGIRSGLVLLLNLVARAGIGLVGIVGAFRALNDPAAGDPPLRPFMEIVPSLVLASFLISLPFALLQWRRQKALERDQRDLPLSQS